MIQRKGGRDGWGPLARIAAAAVLAWLVAGTPGRAEDALPAPAGPVILEVTGAIDRRNGDRGALFDRASLERLGLASIETSTPWTEGVQRFEGVPLQALMDAVGARGEVAVMTALNDYRVEIPLAHAKKWGAIVASKRNGAPMPVREMGPLWLIYPLDSAPEIRTQDTFDSMIWQLRHIEVR